MKIIRNIVGLIVFLAPAKLLGCAVCYGPNIDAPMAEGVNWAILTLGVVITTVLGSFLTFLIYAIRKSEAMEAANAATAPRPQPPSSSLPVEPETRIEELA